MFRWPILRVPDSAQASASAVKRFSSRSIFRRKCSSPCAVQVGRHEDFAAGNGPGPRVRTRNGELVPGAAHPPRAIVAVAHHHQRQPQFRGQIDAAGRQPPPRAARAVGRDRQVHVPALGQQTAQSPPRRRDWSSRARSRSPSDRPHERAPRRRGAGSAASPGCNARADRAERECIRARRCRFSARGTRERSDRPPDRNRPPCSPSVLIHHRTAAEPNRPPSLLRKGLSIFMGGKG